MSVVERTSAGLQTVIPGCERRTLPKSTTRADENGQGLLHFYESSSLREELAKRADVFRRSILTPRIASSANVTLVAQSVLTIPRGPIR